MQIFSAILGLVALTSSTLVDAASPGYRSLPWDGRTFNLTVDTINDKYLTPILMQRNGGQDGNPVDYVSVQYQARPFGYNGDSGQLSIGVDANAIYSTDKDNIEGASDGTTFFRASAMKAEAFLNAYDWRLIFLGSDLFRIGVDASANPPIVYYRINGNERGQVVDRLRTWHLKSAGGNNMVLEFYTSTGQDELALNVTSELPGQLRVLHDFHIGLFTQSSVGSAPAMNAQQDVVSFSGVSVEATAIDAGAPTPAPSMAVTSAS
ncbi:hypothetical protein PHYSODRAFT_293237 [Phytophthora sojae]|uniref:Glycoside hydrolase 131 catalytic N-terminal domain-containing protein n=1 Tax=Phytophthora sojae (strain P6497) TaxID=1094619 RepID=G4YP89_PHYSP|nr:hypothetical protein PHYSODRAFT_293237 [Phytophthora sojae]EGZ27223.1 hypothetical protein PHYSODRAFT_293237 [Phytophthora sojae]|eukprot:XP_009514498.1 hypothetical protein PHYSODRAFT_293237 [Phytophthora sojae]